MTIHWILDYKLLLLLLLLFLNSIFTCQERVIIIIQCEPLPVIFIYFVSYTAFYEYCYLLYY